MCRCVCDDKSLYHRHVQALEGVSVTAVGMYVFCHVNKLYGTISEIDVEVIV